MAHPCSLLLKDLSFIFTSLKFDFDWPSGSNKDIESYGNRHYPGVGADQSLGSKCVYFNNFPILKARVTYVDLAVK